MKTARFILACAAASVLAACGTDPITAPATDARRAAPNAPAGDAVCVKTVVVHPDGTTSEVCVYNSGSQIGSGY